MLARLIEFCVHRRLAALAGTLALAAYGMHACAQTPIEAYPDVTDLQVTVIAQMPGYAPEEVERQVTVPLERALNGTPGMTRLRSESLHGQSLVTLTFDDSFDGFRANTLVAQRAASADLPAGVTPELAPDATPLGEIYQFVLKSDRHDLYQLRSAMQWDVSRVLRQVPGVADVVEFGGFLKEIHVEVNPLALLAHHLSLADVTEALEHSNLNVGGGFLRHGAQELAVRGVGDLRTPDDIKNVVLRSENGAAVTVADVARVVQSSAPRRGTVGFDREHEVVEGFVWLRRGENPSLVLDGVHAKVEELNHGILPEGMHIDVFYDRTTLVDESLATVHHNLALGFVLVVSVVWLFLRSLRASLVIATIIPLALLSAFTALHLLGLPANLISLGAVDFGILLDASIVLVENVVHRIRDERPATRKHMLSVIAHSAADVASPSFYAMAIIIAALLPVFTLERVEGRIFRPLAFTYSAALAGALLFSLTLVPALCALLLRPGSAPLEEPRFVGVLRERFRAALGVALARRRAVLGGACAALLVFAGVTLRLGSEFLPELDEGDFVIFVEMPGSISLDSGQSVLADVREKLLAFPEVEKVLSEQGRPEDGTDDEGVNMSETFVRLRPIGSWPSGVTKDGLVDQMRASLESIPGVRFNFSQPIKDNVEEALSGVRGKVVLKIYGSDLEEMRATLEAAKESLHQVAGITDLELYRDASVPQLQIHFDRAALARFGISVESAQRVVETALGGHLATVLWEGERPVPVRVRLPQGERDGESQIADIGVPAASGAEIPLRELADIGVKTGRASINREANSRYQALKFNVEGRDMGSVVADAMRVVKSQVKVPEGSFLVWGGEFENQQRAMARLRLIVPVALGIVLALLYSALSSARSAATVLLAAPFAMTGGVAAVYLVGAPLSVSSTIGFVALLGQVSLLGLLVVSRIEERRRAGESLHDAVVAGAADRFRAVLMASLLALLGLLPMAVSRSVGSEIQRPFAVVIVGGMLTTAAVVLVILPLIYSLTAAPELRTPEELDEG